MPLVRHLQLVRWSIGRAALLICTVVIGIILVRITVTFLESVATIKGEREDDSDLHHLCARNAAGRSQKMRAACLSAAAENASPILASALLRTSRILLEDMRSSLLAQFLSSNTVMFAVVCAIVMVLQPVLRRWGLLARGATSEDAYGAHGNNHIILVHGDQTNGWPQKPRRFLFDNTNMMDQTQFRNRRTKTPALMLEEEQRELPDEMVGNGNAQGFQTIDIANPPLRAPQSSWWGDWSNHTKTHME
jgi:hypothetical protein